MNKIAVIGFGCAAVHGIQGMREGGYTGEIHVFAPVDTPPENPMLTTYYASGRISPEGRYPFGTVAELQEKYGLTLHLNDPVTRFDAEAKTLTTRSGGVFAWDGALIASGANPWAPPMEGDGGDECFPMRTMADAQRLKDRLAQGGVKTALVVGASMIGIKAVEIFVNAGISCTLADIAPHIFPLAALDGTAARVETYLREKGVELRFNAGAAAIGKRLDGGYTAAFTDGSALDVDLIVLCVGTRTNLPFLIPGQINVNRGIVVDDHMRTSVPGVYAAGDCCEGNNLQSGQTQVIGLWERAGTQGRTAGANLAGENAVCDGGMVQNITHFFEMDFISVGDKRLSGENVSFTGQGGRLYIEAVVEAGQIRCVNLLGGHRISGVIRSRLWKTARGGARGLSPEEIGLLRREDVPEGFITLLGGSGL